MGTFNERGAERRLLRALQRARGPQTDPATATKRLRELAATLPSARRGVTNSVEASKRHARALAHELKLDKGTTYDLVLAAELHEIGKAVLPRDILYSPGELDPALKEIVESHAEQGALLTESLERPVVTAALGLQNEHYDGHGPKGLRGEDSPLVARALAVVAAFVAMCSQRPFRDALDREHALEVLRSQAGRQFDPTLVEAFARTFPQRKVAGAALDAGAALARPLRGAQLAYRRHGRVSTVVLSAFSTVAVVIGATTLAPDGIGRAIERMGWPTKVGPAATEDGIAVIAAADEEGRGGDDSADGIQSSVGAMGAVGAAAADRAFGASEYVSGGSSPTQVTRIQSSYTYRSTDDGITATSPPDDDGTTASGGEGTTSSGGTDGSSSYPDDSDEGTASGDADEPDSDDGGSTSSSKGSTDPEHPGKRSGNDKSKDKKDASTDEAEEGESEEGDPAEPEDTEGSEDPEEKGPKPKETEAPDDTPSSQPAPDDYSGPGRGGGHENEKGQAAAQAKSNGNGNGTAAAGGPTEEEPATEEDPAVDPADEGAADEEAPADPATEESRGNGRDKDNRPASEFKAYQSEDEEYVAETETDDDGAAEASDEATESESLGSMGEQPAATEVRTTEEPAPSWNTLH